MNYDVELNANDSSVLETQYAFTQGDYGQIQFSIRVKANGVYITDAQRAYIVFTLPNGYVVTGADMTKSVATYTYPFQGSELQVPGTIVADVKLVYTDGQISSNKFSFICRYDPLHDKSFSAGPYISQLQQIVYDGQAKIDYLQSLIDILQTDVGGTPVMRSDLQNNRDVTAAGLKAIDANMAQYMLLTSDITNQYENDTSKLAGAASVYGLKTTVDTLNSNLSARIRKGDITRIKLIGDSITEGQGNSMGVSPTSTVIATIGGTTYYETDHNHYCWANFFRDYISRKNNSIEFLNYGIAGKTAKWVYENIDSLTDDSEDVIVVMLGVNDKYIANNETLTDYESYMENLLSVLSLKCNTLIVMSPNPNPDFFTDANEVVLDTSNANFSNEHIDNVLTKICSSNGYYLVSLYREIYNYCRYENINPYHLLDEFGTTHNPHPNDWGYELIWYIMQQKLRILDTRVRKLLKGYNSSQLTLLNGWTISWAGVELIVGKSKNSATITGFIKGGTTAIGTVLAVVPIQFRPNKDQSFYITDWNNTINAPITISTDGSLKIGQNSSKPWDNTKNMMVNITYILEIL